MVLSTKSANEKTEIVFGEAAVLNKWTQCAYNTSDEINIYADVTGHALSTSLDSYLEALRYLKEKGVRIRCITEISETNIRSCKLLMDVVPDMRHLDGLRGAFGVTDREYLATATTHQKEKPVSHAIYSNVRELIEVQKHIFETLWNKSVPGERKIKEIEDGTEPEFLEVMNDSKRSTEIIINLADSITKDALILLPNSKSMVRLHKLGIVDKLFDASKKRNAKIRIICPINDENKVLVDHLSATATNIKVLDGTEGETGMIVVDNSKFFIAEVKGLSNEFAKTIGFGLFSNSTAIIKSIKSFFEVLWKSDELNEKLKNHEKLQAEFINIASHEMKTPIQSILTYSELLCSESEKNSTFEEAILRNASRLKLLSNNLLDLTRIQSNTLVIRKEKFDITGLISTIVDDFQNQIKISMVNPEVDLKFEYDGQMFILADKERIAQAVTNIVNNAVKFTEKGTIHVLLKNEKDRITVSVNDNGPGIDPEIMPNLFTKFTTKHHSGTGVGLYISKKIIEAHDGQIWARNRSNGKGSVFAFSLPIKSM
jgi:signal transduction histidine kinase